MRRLFSAAFAYGVSFTSMQTPKTLMRTSLNRA